MRKILVSALVMVMLFSLAGCSGNKNQDMQGTEQVEEDAAVAEETIEQSNEKDDGQAVSEKEIPEDVQNMYDKSMEVLDLMYDLELGTNKTVIIDMALLNADLESCYNTLKESGNNKKVAIAAQKICLNASKWNDIAVNYTAFKASLDELSAAREEYEKAIDEYLECTGIIPGNSSSSKVEDQTEAIAVTTNTDESKTEVTSSENKIESKIDTGGSKIVLYRDYTEVGTMPKLLKIACGYLSSCGKLSA